MIRVSSSLKNAGLKAVITKLGKTDEITADVAEWTAEEWRGQVHVITHSLEKSIYTQTKDGSTYGQAAAAAASVNPAADVLPEAPDPPRNGARVASCVAHAVYEEYGTSRRPAHPSFRPTVERARRKAKQIMKERIKP